MQALSAKERLVLAWQYSFFPLSNLWRILSVSDKDHAPKPVAFPILPWDGQLLHCVSSVQAFLLAWWLMNGLSDFKGYPALDGTAIMDTSFCFRVVFRWIVFASALCSLVLWMFWYSPWQPKLRKFKFEQEYATDAQLRHEAKWTLVNAAVTGLFECFLCYLWTTGRFTPGSISAAPWTSLAWILAGPYLRNACFFLVHRFVHPWYTERIPDVGRFLYRHCHSWHHKSWNTTPLTGWCQHPVETVGYYLYSLLPVLAGCHPAIALGYIVDDTLGAILAHDGFQFPGSGDYFHHIHHIHPHCNYGTNLVPLDLLFGTFAADKAQYQALRKPQDSACLSSLSECFSDTLPGK